MATHSLLCAAVDLRDLSEGACFWFAFLLLALKLLWNTGLFFEMWYHAWKRDSKQDASYSFHPHIDLLLLVALVFLSPSVDTFLAVSHWQVFKYGIGAILLSYAPILVTAVVAHFYVWVVGRFR